LGAAEARRGQKYMLWNRGQWGVTTRGVDVVEVGVLSCVTGGSARDDCGRIVMEICGCDTKPGGACCRSWARGSYIDGDQEE
jgi:hypothetical protein